MNNFIWAQVFGALAVLANIISVQFRQRLALLAMMVGNCLCFVLAYIFLVQYGGAVVSLLSLLLVIVLFALEKHRSRPPLVLLWVFIALELVGLGFLSKSWLDLLPLAANSLWAVSFFQRNLQRTRLLLLSNFTLWLIFNLLISAWALALGNLFLVASDVMALYRYHRRRRKPVPRERKPARSHKTSRPKTSRARRT